MEAAAAAVTTAEGSAALVVDAPVVEEQIFKAALHRKKCQEASKYRTRRFVEPKGRRHPARREMVQYSRIPSATRAKLQGEGKSNE